MTVKPDFGDASSILWGLAGAVVAAGLVSWRYRVAQHPGPAPPQRGETNERSAQRPRSGRVSGLHCATKIC
ncbi:MAG TPA: hypothetical protein VK926_00495 [Gaiellaceae bacterium]|nr:hypothetical protein [Gaiellaceae bacterium]